MICLRLGLGLSRVFGRLVCAAITIILIAGCAHVTRTSGINGVTNGSAIAVSQYRGRLALKLDPSNSSYPSNSADAPVQGQSFFASFELSGRSEAGELNLYSPLGSTLAKLKWSPRMAILESSGRTQEFASLNDMANQVTGAAVPLASLFSWLAGVDATAAGWETDFSQFSNGRFTARRLVPLPGAELKIILEQ